MIILLLLLIYKQATRYIEIINAQLNLKTENDLNFNESYFKVMNEFIFVFLYFFNIYLTYF